MRMLATILAVLVLVAGTATAQQPATPPVAGTQAAPAPATTAPAAGGGPSLSVTLSGGADGSQRLGSALEIVLLMTLLSLAPAIVLTMTCFTRIIIVLSFLKRAMSMQDLPPALVVTGFSVFLTIFIMKPVVTDIHDTAYAPYAAGEIGFTDAAERATQRLNRFMLRQTRPDDIALMIGLSASPAPATPAQTPFHVTVPSFILSEVKTAFQMGFVLFLPFVVIDLVIASLLVSMGMFTLPPIVVSTPLKLLLFVLVDGWNLVVDSLAKSFG